MYKKIGKIIGNFKTKYKEHFSKIKSKKTITN